MPACSHDAFPCQYFANRWSRDPANLQNCTLGNLQTFCTVCNFHQFCMPHGTCLDLFLDDVAHCHGFGLMGGCVMMRGCVSATLRPKLAPTFQRSTFANFSDFSEVPIRVVVSQTLSTFQSCRSIRERTCLNTMRKKKRANVGRGGKKRTEYKIIRESSGAQ